MTKTVEDTKKATTQSPEVAEFNPPANYSAATANLVLEPDSMKSITDMARVMASGKATIPDHLRNQADCMAVIMQSMQWKMNPFAVAQKTFIIGGKLGYEAQLIAAVAESCGAFKSAPEYEFHGDWKKILGKVKEMNSKDGKGKWYAADWNPKDEDGLGVTISVMIKGETKKRELTVMMSQCWPRFSTQWATDPQQQICYVAVRKFCRRHVPGAILGVYATDELQEFDAPPNRIERSENDLEPYPEAKFESNFPLWEKSIKDNKQTAENIINTVSTKFILSDKQKAKINAVQPQSAVEEEAVDAELVDEAQDQENADAKA